MTTDGSPVSETADLDPEARLSLAGVRVREATDRLRRLGAGPRGGEVSVVVYADDCVEFRRDRRLYRQPQYQEMVKHGSPDQGFAWTLDLITEPRFPLLLVRAETFAARAQQILLAFASDAHSIRPSMHCSQECDFGFLGSGPVGCTRRRIKISRPLEPT